MLPSHPHAARLLRPTLAGNLLALPLVLVLDGYRLHFFGLTALTEVLLAAALGLSVARDVEELVGRLDRSAALRAQRFSWLLLALVVAVAVTAGHGLLLRLTVTLRQVLVTGHLLARTRLGSLVERRLAAHPAQLMLVSFAAIILLGAVLLTFPAATRDGRGASLLDALFTATSATCVTGLVVRDTATYFTGFGQGTILGLIQVGGLGIMTLSASATLLLGSRLGLRGRSLLADMLEASDLQAVQGLTAYIVKSTLLIEAVGALLLAARFALDMPLSRAVYFGAFHSVSAFCNAGFATFSDSLMSYRGDLVVNVVVSALIILGGVGFIVIAALTRRGGARRGWAGASAHVKLVLPATALLLSLGAILFYFVEYNRTLAGLPLGEKLLGACFSSVTARTAGFNTVNTSALGGAGVLLMVVLMFIGGSPGGTAGGIKTTTAGVLLLSVRAMLQGRGEVEAFGRTVPQAVVYKATAIIVVSFLLVVALFATLLQLETQSFERLLFEAVSAFGTVGLSMDVTPALSSVGRLIIVALMYVGRTGPLTLALAIGERPSKGQYRLPAETVMVG